MRPVRYSINVTLDRSLWPGTALVDLKKRSHLSEQCCRIDGFVQDFGANAGELVQKLLAERRVTRNDQRGDMLLRLPGADAIQQAQSIDQRHPQIDDQGIRTILVEDAERIVGIERDERAIPMLAEHSLECFGHSL